MPFPTAGPLPGTPFGGRGGFLIHRVRAGESLESITAAYGVPVGRLAAANPSAAGTLWAGTLLVVPLGPGDDQPLPAFEVYYTTRAEPLEELADRLGVSPEELRTYNGLGPGTGLPAGRWLIIPVSQ